MENTQICKRCNGSKRIMKADGTVQPCWDCLLAGRMDQHSEKIPESKIKL